MQTRIEKLRKEKGLTVSGLEKAVGFSNGSLKKICDKTECNRIYALAEFFGVSMEYLLTGKDAAQPVYSPQNRDFIERLNKLPTEYKKAVYDALKYQEWLYEQAQTKKGSSPSSKEEKYEA